MKKQSLIVKTGLLLILASVFGTIFGGIAANAADDSITRAEWISEIVDLFDMTVDNNNMPDDYYLDIDSKSKYYRDVMVATEFGVVDIEAGRSFEPEAPVTREFAAHTMNYCLGFEAEETIDYPFNDVSDITYIDDALIAYERGWFGLVVGKFLPGEVITEGEMVAIFDDAKAVLANAVINKQYKNTYVFADGVIEIPNDTDVSVDGDGVVTLTDYAETITDGDTFVIYINTIPRAYEAVSVATEENITTIETDDVAIGDVITDADAEGSVTVDLSAAQGVGDVEIEYVESGAKTFLAGSSSLGTVNIKPCEIDLGDGCKITVEGTISNIYFDYKTKGFTYAYAGFSGDYDIDVRGSMELFGDGAEPGYLELVRIPVQGVGYVSVGLDYSVTGTIVLSFSGDFATGLEYSLDGGFRLHKNFTKKS